MIAVLIRLGILMKTGFLQEPNRGGRLGILAQGVVAARSA
jgi:hypothetical protein